MRSVTFGVGTTNSLWEGHFHAGDPKLKSPVDFSEALDLVQLGRVKLHDAEFTSLLRRAAAFNRTLATGQNSFDATLDQEKDLCQTLVEKHFLPNGAILASFDKPYYFDWGRDAAIVFDTALSGSPLDANKEALLDSQLKFDAVFRKNAPTFPGGLGEARADVNGNWAGPWGTPQFDAAALKAMAFSDYGLALIGKGENQKAASEVYPPVHDYLQYLIANNDKPCFDPWEEINAEKHFWTEMSKAVAFQKGSKLAQSLGQKQDAQEYASWSQKIIHDSLQGIFFQDSGDKIIFPHYHVLNPGSAGKHSILDSQVLGALLLGKQIGYPVPLDNPFALHTFISILNAFKALYPINQNAQPDGAVAIGRYPDDAYGGPDGMGKGGNPWIISTLWAGQYFYDLASGYLKKGEIDLSQGQRDDLQDLIGFQLPQGSSISNTDPAFQAVVDKLSSRGDAELTWVMNHVQPSGDFSEQVDRHTGNPASVSDLAWSDAAFVQTVEARDELQKAMAAQALQAAA